MTHTTLNDFFNETLAYLKKQGISLITLKYESEGNSFHLTSIGGLDKSEFSRDIEAIIECIRSCYFKNVSESELGRGIITIDLAKALLNVEHEKAVYKRDCDRSINSFGLITSD